MKPDIDREPFPNIGNNPFYHMEFSIGNMLPQIPLYDNDVICRSVRPYAKEPKYIFELLDEINLVAVNEASGDNKKYPVYIMLMHSGTALANAINGITHSEYSHSSISFDASMTQMYSFGRKADMNPFIGGFKVENIYTPFFQTKDIPYALYVVPCTIDQIKLMKQRLDFFIKNQSKFKYDFTGLFKNYFGIVDNPEYKWFCSRFVSDIINAGYPNSALIKNPNLVKPEDFKNMTFATYVTGGNLKDYNPNKVKQITSQIFKNHNPITTESKIACKLYENHDFNYGDNVSKPVKTGSDLPIYEESVTEPKPTKDGFIGNDNVWNSMVIINGKRYRERAEVIIIKDDEILLNKKSDGTYKLPGGSSEPDHSLKEQAIREAQEEVHITPINLAYYGSYKKLYKLGTDYDGYISHVFVGMYGKAYNGYVKKADRDNKMLNESKFYKISDVLNELIPEHKKALKSYIRTVSESAELITESWIEIQDNLKINLDKWRPGNPLWICGASGDGKSTLTKEIANKYKAEIVTGDIVLMRIASTPEKFLGKLQNAKDSHNMSVLNSPALDYVNMHPELPSGARDPITKKWNNDIIEPEMIKFFMWFMDQSFRNPKYNKKLYIIDSCDICLMNPDFMVQKPLIIMGGSRLRSLWRRANRDKLEKGGWLLKYIFKYIKNYNIQNRKLDDDKEFFRNTVSLMRESTSNYPPVTAKEVSRQNPNDTLSKKGIKLTFFDRDSNKIGEASISSIDTPTGFLYDVEVFPKFRGKGYGNSIIDYVLKHYKVTELTVEPSNIIAINLYKKFGFREDIKFKENGKDMIDMKRGVSRKAKEEEKEVQEYVKRSELPDDVFGIPQERKYPMPDEKHTISAMKLFNHCENKYEEQLAKHIIKNIKKYNIDPSFIGPKNRLIKYLDKANLIKEGVISMDDTNQLIDNMLYEFFGDIQPKSDADILFEKYFGEASKSDDIKSVPNKIEPMVKKLENKHYRVKYASPGHSNTRFENDANNDGVINGKMVSTGRIIFERDYHFDNTPKGWEWKSLSNGFKALYVKPYTYDKSNGSEKEAFEKWQNEYLANLDKWVEDLPMQDSKHPRNEPEEDKNFN